MSAEIRHEWRDCAGVRLHCAPRRWHPPAPGDPGAKKLQFKLEDFMVRVPDASHWIVHEKPDLVSSEIERFAGLARV